MKNEKIMTPNTRGTAQLGDLIAAAFDEAAGYTSDPKQVSSLATRAVLHMLRRAPKAPAAQAAAKTVH